MCCCCAMHLFCWVLVQQKCWTENALNSSTSINRISHAYSDFGKTAYNYIEFKCFSNSLTKYTTASVGEEVFTKYCFHSYRKYFPCRSSLNATTAYFVHICMYSKKLNNWVMSRVLKWFELSSLPKWALDKAVSSGTSAIIMQESFKFMTIYSIYKAVFRAT